MLPVKDQLNYYLKVLKRLSHADSVTLYLPLQPTGVSKKDLFLSVGKSAQLCEFGSQARARIFFNSLDSPKPLLCNRIGDIDYYLRKSRVQGIWLLALPLNNQHQDDLPVSIQERRSADANNTSIPCDCVWFSLSFETQRPPAYFIRLEAAESTILADEPASGFLNVLALGHIIIGHSREIIINYRDQLTELPKREEFQAILGTLIRNAQPFSLLFISPDEFNLVNERFSWHQGDHVMFDIACRLQSILRKSDTICRFGGALFAVTLVGVDAKKGKTIAQSCHRQLTDSAYLNDTIALTFSIGGAGFDPSGTIEHPDRVALLIHHADLALKAEKVAGGGKVRFWAIDTGEELTLNWDRLNGIYTASTTKDYRNMLLLWDVISIVSGSGDFNILARQFINRLTRTFHFNRLCLLNLDEQQKLQLITGIEYCHGKQLDMCLGTSLTLSAKQSDLLTRALQCQQSANNLMCEEMSPEQVPLCCYAFPLMAQSQCLGVLYLESRLGKLRLDAPDLMFLQALTHQLAGAFERTLLNAELKQRKEQERLRLRTELNELRQAARETRLVFHSVQMRQLLARLKQAASTDVTVLLCGESGTGKELLAHTIHELSTRSDQPFVIVDCGAIAESLLENELFGHEKGAYTGAEQSTSGSLAKADGGTLLLDEIGDLPLAVQVKFLRLVQEKEFTPVGGTQSQRVNVRIIAATNRDLAYEVKAGRFREDLYYRLNVVAIDSPPLRQRPDDILHLAAHFLQKFALQYQKKVTAFSAGLMDKMEKFSWPGNVRELQNRVQQAVIFAQNEVISSADMMLEKIESKPDRSLLPLSSTPSSPVSSGLPLVDTSHQDRATADGDGVIDAGDHSFRQVMAALDAQIDVALRDEVGNMPIGEWLREDLILTANDLADGVARQAAKTIGMPSSTYSRRLQQLKTKHAINGRTRTAGWTAIQAILPAFIAAHNGQSDLLKHIQRHLLRQIFRHRPFEVKLAARLMAISEPTVHHWLADTNDHPDDQKTLV